MTILEPEHNPANPDSSETNAIKELLSKFNQRYDEPRPLGRALMASSLGVNAAGDILNLRRIAIPGMKLDVKTEAADVGINYHTVHLSASGLVVLAQAYDNMEVTDWIDVFWDDVAKYDDDTLVPVASRGVSAEELGQDLPLYIPAGKVPGQGVVAGVVKAIWFRVTRLPSQNKTKSPWLSVLSRLVFPGGTDPEPDAPGHQHLQPPQPTLPGSGVIGEAEAAAGVKVTIAPYPNMRQYDRIRLSWGGEFVIREVLPGEEGRSVEIVVQEETIRKAGDSDALVLTYRVIDEVDNQSSDWSLRTSVKVELGDGLLQAPYIMNPDPAADPADVIDLGALGEANLGIEVDTPRPDFAVNDTIVVVWSGTTAQGETAEYSTPEQSVVRVGQTLKFSIPNASLLTLGGGRGAALYLRGRAGQELASKRTFVAITGAIPLRPSPTLVEAVEGVVEPTLPQVRVEVPAAARLERGDRVTLTWLGTRPNGTPLLHQVTRTVSSAQAGKVLPFTVAGAGLLAPLNGGSLDLSYRIVRAGLEVPLDSEHEVLQVGAVQSALPAPMTRPLFPGDRIDPDEYRSDIEIVIGTFANMRQTQSIFLEWTASVGAPFFDDLPVTPGEETVFFIEHAQLQLNNDGEVKVRYRVVEAGEPDRFSEFLTLQIGAGQSIELPAPLVLEAVDGILDPNAARNGATFRVPLDVALEFGETVDFFWEADTPEGTWSMLNVTVDQNGRVPDQTVPYQVVNASNNSNVRVRYLVIRNTGNEHPSLVLPLRIQSSALVLPPATFIEAVAGNLNPDDVRNGATLLIDSVAKIRPSDYVLARIAPRNSNVPAITLPFTVATVEPNGSVRLLVEFRHIERFIGLTVDLSYTLRRFSQGGNPPEEQAGATTYTVNRTIGTGTLRIFGARYGASTYRASGSSRVLSAFDRTTLQPILAEWQYLGDTLWRAGYTWLDKEPQRALRVRSSNDSVLLYPGNVIGNGNDAVVNGTAAYAVMLQNYKTLQNVGQSDPNHPNNPRPLLFSIYGWGNAAYGGTVPPTLITYDDVIEVSSTRSAYAALRQGGALACWGNSAEGGATPAGNLRFLEVRSNSTAFVGRVRLTPGSNNARVIAWGNAANGGSVPAAIGALTDITAVFGNGLAFAAQRSNGQVVAWGNAASGGTVPGDIGNRGDLVIIKGNYAAFAARRQNKSLVAWGNPSYGAAVPAPIAARRDIETLEGATAQAFSALSTAGEVVVWGAASHGGSLPTNLVGRQDFIEVTSTWHAFCARHRNGSVVAWGNATNGGTVPAPIAVLRDIVQVTGSAWSFAALRRNGTVVAWGAAASGGDTSAVVAQLTNVRAVYANSHGFTALTSDGRVVSWGNGPGGGDNSSAQGVIRSRLLTGVPDPDALAVKAADNELRGLA
ncbi:RCC1 domain-containing protein [Pseudomonas sp.]|uniref:RCC1 domain-containing protein n=1 Tax=Pseudomonas sp. TaxID=306 RepID=UPI003D6F52D4